MPMSRINDIFRIVLISLFFVVYFLYFFLYNPFHIIYQEQIQLFRFDTGYFYEFLSRPGGISEYSGAFLTQFFIYPAAGAAIITLAGFAVFALTAYIFSKHRLNGVIWQFIPVLLIAALQSFHLYVVEYSIGLIVSLAYFAIYISVRNNKWRYLFLLSGWPLIYMFSGGYALLAIVLCFMHELFFIRNRPLLIILPLYPILALLVPYLAAQSIYYLKEGSEWTIFLPFFLGLPYKYILICLLIYFPLVLALLKVLFVYSGKDEILPGWELKNVIAGTIILAGLYFGVIKFGYDKKTEILLGIDHCVQQSDWDGVLKLSSSAPVTNLMIMYFTNLALYKSGRMADQMFAFPQSGTDGLWLDWSHDWLIAFFGGGIYYHLAYNSEAYRWAFEAMVARGPNPRSLKCLALTSLVNNDINLAEKYLKMLDQTLFYRKWARHYLLYADFPERIDEDKDISEKRRFLVHTDFISSDNFGVRLPYLLSDHPENRMAFEYLMAALLLDKNLGDFAANIYRIKELGYKSIPVHYEEALLAYMSYLKKDIVPEGYTISPATRNRLADYANTIYSFGDNTEKAARDMAAKFGNTYWYYLKFINNQ
jgi:hypothetical protein